MTDYGGGGGSTITANASILQFSSTIPANQNKVTVTHNLGRIVKVNGVYGNDDNASVFKIINQGVNSFDVAFQGGITQPTDTLVQGTYE